MIIQREYRVAEMVHFGKKIENRALTTASAAAAKKEPPGTKKATSSVRRRRFRLIRYKEKTNVFKVRPNATIRKYHFSM